MQKFVDGLKDFLYDSIDYIIMIGIIGLVVLIIGWRLDLLFANDLDDIIQDENIIVEQDDDEDESYNPIHEEEDETEPAVEADPKPENPVEPEKPVVNSPSNKTVTITIPAGSNLANIAGILESNGLVSSKTDFINKSEELQLATKVKAGSFQVIPGSSMEDILNVLTK